MDGPAPLVFSANLGFLYTDLPLSQRIEAAAADGFDAVEMHDPYETDAQEVIAALRKTGLACLSINTRMGDRQAGEFGLAALAGRERDARALIDEAVGYAARIGCPRIHVPCGTVAEGQRGDALSVYLGNLRYAAHSAAQHDITIMIEPINRRDVPDYFLSRADQAAAIIADAGERNIAMMFDLYHAQITGGDIVRTFARHRDVIAHVQIAAVPSRAEPDGGELDMAWVIGALRREGYRGAFGAEYRPAGTVREGLSWLSRLRAALAGG